MQFRNLGKSGLKVSEISLGSWLTYGGYVEKQLAIDTIHRAYEAGVNFYDTANVYMRGEAEIVVGEALKGYSRDSVVLATKVCGQMGDGPNDRGLSRKHIMDQCDASLKRLGMDYIDLYYCHSFDASTPMQETLRALDDLVRQGKVLYVGVSNWSAAQMTEAIHLADRFLLDRIVASQPPYSMLKRDIEQDILPTCDKLGIGQVVYSPLAQGVLSGKYKTMNDVPKGSRRDTERGSQIISRYLTETNLERVQQLQAIAAEAELSMTQLALAWVLRQPGVSSAIIGASSPPQLEENVKVTGIQLAQEHLERIEAILK